MILLTAIESFRENKKKTKKKQKQKNKRTGISKGSTPRSASFVVASLETAEAWSEHNERKSGYQWISVLKMLGKFTYYVGQHNFCNM